MIQLLETDRLLLRRWEETDEAALISIASKAHVQRWHSDWHGCGEWVLKWIQNRTTKGYVTNDPLAHFMTWAITLKETGQVIGMISVGGDDFDGKEPSIGYFLNLDHENRGYMTEAVTAFCTWVFGEFGYPFLSALVQLTNEPSGAVVRKCGFRLVGETTREQENGEILPFSHYRLDNPARYTLTNAARWDEWVEGGIPWGIPITHEAFLKAKAGKLELLLTPETFVPLDWYPTLKGAKVLGLASGGGQQLPVLTAHGADCTLLDISDRQRETERMVAEREGYAINILRGDMTEPLPFSDNSFDLIFHPVSNCYIREVEPIWQECYRVLRPGGVLLAGITQPIVYCFPDDEQSEAALTLTYPLPYDPVAEEQRTGKTPEEVAGDGYQFSHSLETQIGGQLKAGLQLTHLIEDRDRNWNLDKFFPTFIMTRAIKPFGE